TLFPYTTLFRSIRDEDGNVLGGLLAGNLAGEVLRPGGDCRPFGFGSPWVGAGALLAPRGVDGHLSVRAPESPCCPALYSMSTVMTASPKRRNAVEAARDPFA